MLELFRKYSGIAFVVLILLFFGLIFMVDGVGRGGVGSGPKMMSYDGRAYTQSEVERQGSDYGQMFTALLEPGRSTAYEPLSAYISAMGVNPRGFDPINYLACRLELKKEAEAFGVTPSESQIENFIQETIFADNNGEFNQAGYTEFIEKRVKRRFGLGVQDFNSLVGEIISVSRLQKVVAAGFSLDEVVTKKSMKLMMQEVTYEQFSLPLTEVKKAITPTEEEVEAYWTEHQEDYKTSPQVKIQYVVADANLAAVDATYQKEEKEKARAAGKTEEELKGMQFTLPVEQKQKLIDAAADKVDRLFVKVQDAEGEGFSSFAEELGLKVMTTDFVTGKTATADLKRPLFQSSGTPMFHAIKLPAASGMDSITDVLSTSEGNFMLIRVVERQEAETMAYAEAKEKAKAAYIDDRAVNSLEDEIGKIKEKLAAQLKADNGEDVAKSLNLKYAKQENASLRKRLPGEPSGAEFFSKVIKVEDNVLSEAIIQRGNGQERAVILRPLSRQFNASEENLALIDRQLEQVPEALKNIVFTNWFGHKVAGSGLERH